VTSPNKTNVASGPAQENGSQSDYRREARRLALQFLHQLAAQDGKNLDQLDFFLGRYGTDLRARQLAQKWICGTWQDLNRIDAMIAQVSTNWDLHRINQVDCSNLRLAAHQLLDCPDIPVKVVINEAVELAKEFSTARSSGFVNGVLDAIHRKLLPKTV